MPEDNQNNEESQNNDSDENKNQDEENSSQSSENNSQDKDEEDDKKDEPTFHPHKGKILQIKPYTIINKANYDSKYGEPTGSGSVDLIIENDDVRYIYSGVSCKLKLRRDTDRQFSATGIEEVYDEENIKIREHIPTDEQISEYNSLIQPKMFVSDEYKDYDVYSTLVSRSASDDGLYGFVTEVSHKQELTSLKLKDWGLCLEDTEKELEFSGLFRSEVICEVAKSYGLTPIVDLGDLEDDVITWNNKKSMGTSKGSANDNNLEESKTLNECSNTFDLSSKAKVSAQGDVPSEITEDMYATIGKEDTNYGKWAKGKTPQEVMSGLRSVYKWKSGYSDNAIYKCPDEYFSTEKIYVNCADAARLVKCCMDVIGTKCICIHCPGHYYNAIEVNGEWLTCDLTNSRQCKTKTGSNKFGY